MTTTPIKLYFEDGCAVEFGFPEAVSLGLSTPALLPIDFDVGTIIYGEKSYQGSYEITPTDEAQTIPVHGLSMLQDLVIDPIPNNYGFITWDGSTITVS